MATQPDQVMEGPTDTGEHEVDVTMHLDGVNVMEKLPTMKRARINREIIAGADTASPSYVWQVCLEEGWKDSDLAGNGRGGATWIDLEGSWKHAVELLLNSTQAFGDNVWQVVSALGPDAWPRAQTKKLNHPQIEYSMRHRAFVKMETSTSTTR